jgi:hypothetical protein
MKKGILFLFVFLAAATFCYADDTIGLVHSYPGNLLATKNGDAVMVFHETQANGGVYTNTIKIKAYDKESGAVVWTTDFSDLAGYNFCFCNSVENEIVFVFSRQANNAVFRTEKPMEELLDSGDDTTNSDIIGIIKLQHRPSEIVSVDLSTGSRNWVNEIDGNVNTLKSASEGGWYVRYTQYDGDKIIENLTALSSNGATLWNNVIHEETIVIPDIRTTTDESSTDDGVLESVGVLSQTARAK